jgi:uncharacterized membrane protein
MNEQRIKASRLEAISDGVFAIAMTLLVLGLKLPALDGPSDSDAFRAVLAGQLPHVVSWIISFAVLCRLWITQHALLKDGTMESLLFTWLNFAFLGTISFIPFPTSLISEHPDQPWSVVIFSMSFVLSGLMLALMSLVKQTPTQQTPSWQTLNLSAKRIIIGLPIIGVIAILLAFWHPRVGVSCWFILPFFGFSRKKKQKRKDS